VPNSYFQAAQLGTANNFLVNMSGYLACFTPATTAAVQQYGAGSCPNDYQCVQMVSDGPPYVDPAFPYTNGIDQFYYWRGAPARCRRPLSPGAARRGRERLPLVTCHTRPFTGCHRACVDAHACTGVSRTMSHAARRRSSTCSVLRDRAHANPPDTHVVQGGAARGGRGWGKGAATPTTSTAPTSTAMTPPARTPAWRSTRAAPGWGATRT